MSSLSKDLIELNWGVVGLGRIAHLFVQDLLLVPQAKLQAVGSSSKERANQFALQYGAEKSYGSYQELFADPEVQVVYVAGLHPDHRELSIAAMKAGKHVLCEKPVAMNAPEAEDMIDQARRNGVFFMEAFWSRFNPNIREVYDRIQAGEIGTPRFVQAEFSFFKLNDSLEDRSLDVAKGGGSLMDMGVYSLFLAYLILGKPQEVLARAQFHSTGAEVQTSIILQYDNAQALLYSGFAHDTSMRAKIGGEAGCFFLEPMWHETQGYTHKKGMVEEYHERPTIGKGFTYEIAEVHKCIGEGKKQSPLWSWKQCLELISLVDAVRAEAGIHYPFE
jgi:predicted dehydrogenase